MNRLIYVYTLLAIVQGHHKMGRYEKVHTADFEPKETKITEPFDSNSKHGNFDNALMSLTYGCRRGKMRNGKYQYYC